MLLHGTDRLIYGSSGRGRDLPILPRCAVRVLCAELIPKIVILTTQSLTLLLERLQVPILLGQLILQLGDLTETTGLVELLRLLALGFGVTFVALDLLLKLERLEYHGVGAVEDQRKEQGEAAEVHVALGVEFTGLYLHTFGAT